MKLGGLSLSLAPLFSPTPIDPFYLSKLFFTHSESHDLSLSLDLLSLYYQSSLAHPSLFSLDFVLF